MIQSVPHTSPKTQSPLGTVTVLPELSALYRNAFTSWHPCLSASLWVSDSHAATLGLPGDTRKAHLVSRGQGCCYRPPNSKDSSPPPRFPSPMTTGQTLRNRALGRRLRPPLTAPQQAREGRRAAHRAPPSPSRRRHPLPRPASGAADTAPVLVRTKKSENHCPAEDTSKISKTNPLGLPPEEDSARERCDSPDPRQIFTRCL